MSPLLVIFWRKKWVSKSRQQFSLSEEKKQTISSRFEWIKRYVIKTIKLYVADVKPQWSYNRR